MTTLERVRAEIQKVLDKERDFTSENAKAQAIALNWVLALFDKYAEQEPTDEWQNGYDRAWEEAEVFYEKEEPTIPCDLCGFNTDEVCEYLSVCPAIGKAVSKCQHLRK